MRRSIPLLDNDPLLLISQADLEEVIESWPVEPSRGTVIQRVTAWLAEIFGAVTSWLSAHSGDARRIPRDWQ